MPYHDADGAPALQVDANADGTTTVRLSGLVGRETLAIVRRAFESAGGSGPLIVDLTGVAFLDSSGIGLLFVVARNRGLELVLGPGCPVFPVVAVSGLDEVASLRTPR